MTALTTPIDEAESRFVQLLMSPETAEKFDRLLVTGDDNDIGLRIEYAVEDALFRLVGDDLTDEEIDNLNVEAYVRDEHDVNLALTGLRFR